MKARHLATYLCIVLAGAAVGGCGGGEDQAKTVHGVDTSHPEATAQAFVERAISCNRDKNEEAVDLGVRWRDGEGRAVDEMQANCESSSPSLEVEVIEDRGDKKRVKVTAPESGGTPERFWMIRTDEGWRYDASKDDGS